MNAVKVVVNPHANLAGGEPRFTAPVSLVAGVRVGDNVAVDDDLWMLGGTTNTGSWAQNNAGTWVWAGNGEWGTPFTSKPGTSTGAENLATGVPGIGSTIYQSTSTQHRDVVWVAPYRPAVTKAVDKPVANTGETVTFTLTGRLSTNVGINGTGDLTLTDTMQKGLTYVPGSANPAPASVQVGPTGTQLVWNFPNSQVNPAVPATITYQAVADYKSGQRVNTVVADGTGMGAHAPQSWYDALSASATVQVTQPGLVQLHKTSSSAEFAMGGQATWNLSLSNRSNGAVNRFDVIDVLPFNGDGRGTDFHGRIRTDEVTTPAGVQVWYSTATPSTIPEDPADPFNSTTPVVDRDWDGDVDANDLLLMPAPDAVNGANWTQTKPADATSITAVRFTSTTQLEAGEELPFTIAWKPVNSHDHDQYHNYAWAKTDLDAPALRLIRAGANSVLVEAAKIQVDKTRFAVNGVTVPAGTVPLVEPGDVLSYTITARNSDPVNTASDVTVTEQPLDGLDAGSVKIVTPPAVGKFDPATGIWNGFDLAPGEKQSMEISVQVRADFTRDTAIRNKVTISTPECPLGGPCVTPPPPDTGDKCPGGGIPNDVVEADTDQVDCTADVPYQAEVAIEKHHTSITENKGSDGKPDGTFTVAWEVTVKGMGPQDSRNVLVRDAYPAGTDPAKVTLVSVSKPYDVPAGTAAPNSGVVVTQPGFEPAAALAPGVFDPATGAWNIGYLPAGQVATATFTTVHTGDVLKTTGVVNKATVTSREDWYDGGTKENGTVDEDDDNYDADLVNLVDVKVHKEASGKATQLDNGDVEVSWEIEVGNFGAAPAHKVVVTDLYKQAGVIPRKTEIKEAPTKGRFDTATGAWTVGTLEPEERATLTITTVIAKDAITPDGKVTNAVNITSLEDPWDGGKDPNPDLPSDDDNYDESWIDVAASDDGVAVVDAGAPGFLAAADQGLFWGGALAAVLALLAAYVLLVARALSSDGVERERGGRRKRQRPDR